MKRKRARRVAEHRPANRRRRFAHDDLIAVDLFSGFGGLTRGIEAAGFTTIMAANHNAYKVEVHERNHPNAEHWIADLVDPDASDYHSAADLPPGDILVAGISCTNHTQANTKKAYKQGLTLFDLPEDEEYEERVTRSERDRATALCVLQYAARHRPRMILVECTTEFQSWGPARQDKPKIGDGSTYRWWLRELAKLDYQRKILFLNSQFFGVPQSRDRWFGVFWNKAIPAPDLEHRPLSWCGLCDEVLPAVWTWKTGIPPSGSVRYGKQYIYTCPRCRREVVPPMAPSIGALDLSNLGTRIGDRVKPLAPATMARADRCRQRFGEFPAILMPAKATHGIERTPWQPLATQTSQQETALPSTGERATVAVTGGVIAAHRHNGDGQHLGRPMDTVTTTPEKALLLAAVANFQGSPRGVSEALPTQGGSETLGLLTARVLPNRTNGTSRHWGEPMETLVGNAGSGGLSILSTGVVPLRKKGAPRGVDEPLPTQAGTETLSLLSAGVVPFRRNTVPTVATAEAMPTVTADQTPGLLTAAGIIKNNGSIEEADYRAHPVTAPLGAVVASASNQALLTSGWWATQTAEEWRRRINELPLEDCYFRMLGPHEVGRGCGFDVDFPDHQGSFTVWGSARDQVDGFGNAVSPQVGEWIGKRLRAALHGEVRA